jgi:hypothetical protein
MVDCTIPFNERISCTVPVACQTVGLGRTKLYELIGAGRVKAIKVDGRTLVTVASLRSLINGDEATAGQVTPET